MSTTPSPQLIEHTLAVIESPKVHAYPISTAQLASQPSPGVVLPSSQYPLVGDIDFPSPQISLQILAVEGPPNVQVQPASTLQLKSQPSPKAEFPSSQYPINVLITIPSPQTSVQELAVKESPNVQLHPVSTAQLASQPSPVAVLPSSQ